MTTHFINSQNSVHYQQHTLMTVKTYGLVSVQYDFNVITIISGIITEI